MKIMKRRVTLFCTILTAKEMTRARSYILAGYLADARDETFTIPSEIQESIDRADPSLNTVFEKFEGQWIFDEERSACVGIERTEACAYRTSLEAMDDVIVCD